MLAGAARGQSAAGSNQGGMQCIRKCRQRLALSLLASAALMVPIVAEAAPADEIANAVKNGEVVDLTVTVAENYPAHWPFHPPFKRWTMNWFERSAGAIRQEPDRKARAAPRIRSTATRFQSVFPYYSQQYVIDDHTGTQIDYPAHFVPPPDSGRGVRQRAPAG